MINREGERVGWGGEVSGRCTMGLFLGWVRHVRINPGVRGQVKVVGWFSEGVEG